MMLKVLAIVMGILVAATRLLGVASPELVRRMIKLLLDRKVFALVMMVIAAVVGSLFIWGFRLYAAAPGAVPWQACVLLAFGILMVVVGLTGLIYPNLMFSLASKFYVTQSSTLRLLSLVGVVAGIVLILLGVYLPEPPPTL